MSNPKDLSPPILRKWADHYRSMAEGMKWQTRTDPVEDVVQLYETVAVLLDREAARLEAGERVCRWVLEDPCWYERGCDVDGASVFWRVSQPAYCFDCGGRVVLGDEEASDE